MATKGELLRQVVGKRIKVEWYKRDLWKHLVGVIRLDGKVVNPDMINRGLAWECKSYEAQQTPK